MQVFDPLGYLGYLPETGDKVRAGVAQGHHSGQAHRLLVALQKGARCFAVGGHGPLGDRLASAANEFKCVAHPDFVHLDIGVRGNGVLQFIDARDQHRIDLRIAALRGGFAVQRPQLDKHAAQQLRPHLHLRGAGLHDPGGFRAAPGFFVKLVAGEFRLVPDAERDG